MLVHMFRGSSFGDMVGVKYCCQVREKDVEVSSVP